ncbi:MAG TPA: phosphotransferase family protein [Stellaceae bacterium]|nr:phosphotransferase family protein [Stellaceae bacterium]
MPPNSLEAAELIAERPDERLDTTRLSAYLRARLPAAQGALSVAQFHGGKANLTYLLTFGEQEFVLRRPPLGPIPPGAHDMRREHRVLSVLHRRYPLAPQSLLLCEDESVIGAVFIVEERRRGFVIRDDVPAPFAGRPELNRRIGLALVDALADLHRVDAAEIGLADLGRVDGYLERQLAGWTRRWEASLGGPQEAASRAGMRPALDWLAQTRPGERAAALLHNDYRLDNCLLATDDPARLVAVLDWDMCTRGDPLADLGYLLNYWVEPGDPPEWREIAAMPTWRDGFPSRAEAAARYAERSGSDVGGIRWYEVFAAFKLAVIILQIYIRYVRGQTQDRRFAGYAARVLGLARKASALIG